MKAYLVPDQELIALLGAEDLKEVDQFPHRVNQYIVIEQRGTVVLSDGESDAGQMSAGTRHASVGVGHPDDPTYVGLCDKYPRVVFIRSGNRGIAAFHETGRLLSNARRD